MIDLRVLGALNSHKKSNKHLDLETKMAGSLVLSDCFKSTQPQKIANTRTSRNIMEECHFKTVCKTINMLSKIDMSFSLR